MKPSTRETKGGKKERSEKEREDFLPSAVGPKAAITVLLRMYVYITIVSGRIPYWQRGRSVLVL